MIGKLPAKDSGIQGVIAYWEKLKTKKTLPAILRSFQQVLPLLENAVRALNRTTVHDGRLQFGKHRHESPGA